MRPSSLLIRFTLAPSHRGLSQKLKSKSMNEKKISRSATTTETPSPSGLQQKAKQAAQAAQTEVQKLKGAAREQGSTAVEEVKTVAQSAAREAQEAGRDFVHEQKENLAQKVHKYAEAVRAASEGLRGEEGNVLADPAQKAAEQLEAMSSYLREKELADFLDDLESFTRRRPEVVFGGLFVMGLAAARFFKASRRRPRLAGPPEPVDDAGTSELAAAAPSSAPIPATTEPLSAPPAFPLTTTSSPEAAQDPRCHD
jgi:hypothetical protein